MYFLLQPLQSSSLTLFGAMEPAMCPTTIVWVAEAEPARASWATTAAAATGMVAFHAHPRTLVKRFRTSVSSRFWPTVQAPENFPACDGQDISHFENAPAGESSNLPIF